MASITLPVAAVDVGYFSTKYTSGRAEHKQASSIKAGSIPSICPRVAGEAAATAGMSALSGVVVTVNNIPFNPCTYRADTNSYPVVFARVLLAEPHQHHTSPGLPSLRGF